MDIDKLIKKRKYSYDELKFIVDSYMSGAITDEKMTLFLKRVCKKGLSLKETIDLTDIYIKSGDVVDLSTVKVPCVDKHSTGGIGDKVSLIVGPIVASLDVAVPKMSGRGLGYTGGTVDKLESIDGYRVELTQEEFVRELNDIKMSIISQTSKITPADKKIYALRDVTNTVESTALIAASIMSKKIACGTNNIVIDLKVGNGAFMKNARKARKLVKYMKKIGEHFNKNVICVLTRMDTPLGRNVGNNLEVIEAIEFFDGKWSQDLGEVVLTIASQMVALGKNISSLDAMKQVKEAINSGQAREKFYSWISYQGGNINTIVKPCKKMLIKSAVSGYIKSISALGVGELVRDLGGGRINKDDVIDYAAGFKIIKKEGEKVEANDVIAEVYFNKEIPDVYNRALSLFTFSNKPIKAKSAVMMIL